MATGSVEIRNGTFNISSNIGPGIISGTNEIILGEKIKSLTVGGNPHAFADGCVPKYDDSVYYPIGGSLTESTVVFGLVEYYNVSFDGNGADGTMENMRAKNSEKFELPECKYTIPAFGRFAGWKAEDGTGGRKIYTCTLNTLQMAEEIEAVFHYGDKEISETYSLEKYFQYIEDHKEDYDDKTMNLVHVVENYGYYAQPYLTALHNLDDKYAKITLNYPVTFDYEAIKTAVSKYKFTKTISTDCTVNGASYKLSLDSNTALSVMVKVPEGTEVSMTASFGGKTYKDVTKQNSTTYVIKITGIKATQLGETITVTGSAGGNFTITVSALSYVRSILEGGDKYSEDARKTVAALYQYYEAAEKFKNS